LVDLVISPCVDTALCSSSGSTERETGNPRWGSESPEQSDGAVPAT